VDAQVLAKTVAPYVQNILDAPSHTMPFHTEVSSTGKLTVHTDKQPDKVTLWTAESVKSDFRFHEKVRYVSKDMSAHDIHYHPPKNKHIAYFVELTYGNLTFSTPVYVRKPADL
jgi:PhoPQ-activated pathogenicity-related protein